MARPVQRMKTARAWSRLPLEVYEEVKIAANRLGIEYSKYLAMCIITGHKALQRAIYPEEMLSPRQLAEIAKIANEDQEKEKALK
jgi:hypothetical protein